MKRTRHPSSASDMVFTIAIYFIAALAFLITLYPFVYILSVSFSNSDAVYRGQVFLWPVGFSLAGYKQVLQQNGLWSAYGNTIFYTVAGTLFNLIATCIAAYPLSRRSMVGRRFFNFIIVFTMYFSGGLIPSYLLITPVYLSRIRKKLAQKANE